MLNVLLGSLVFVRQQMLKMLITLSLNISVKAFLPFMAMHYGDYFHCIRALLSSCSTESLVKCMLVKCL